MRLERRLSIGDGGTDLNHVRAEDALLALHQVVGVVLNERDSSRAIACHDLAESNQRRCLPITLSPKTIALGHESLTRKTRQLLQTVQVLKSCRESTEASLFKEPSHGNLLARCAVEALSMLPVFLDR